MNMESLLSPVVAKAVEKTGKKNTYTDQSGVKRCACCKRPVEAFIEAAGEVLPVACACDERDFARAKEREAAEKANRLAQESPLYDRLYAQFSFPMDDAPQSYAGRISRRFVEAWDTVKTEDYGLLYSGPVGTGKSFYAAAVVNALRERGVSALICTTSRLVNAVRVAKSPQAVIDDLNRFELVALDDLGAERDTEYAVEQLEAFINARSLARLPLIVTTNLTGEQLKKPDNLAYTRIYDRVLEMCCFPVQIVGESRRKKLAQERRASCKALLADEPGIGL